MRGEIKDAPSFAFARRVGLTVLLASCGWVLSACDAWRYHDQIKAAMFSPRRADPARLDVRGRVPILHLYGTPDEIGRQYGELMRPALRALSSYSKCILSAAERERFLENGRKREPVLPDAIRRQLRATADAGDISYDELVALNVTPRLACSTLAVWGPATPDGRMLMGRNSDYFGLGLDDCGSMVVVYHPADGPAVMLVSFLGMAGGFAGMNGHGVAFTNMLVFNSRGWRDDGLPIQLAMRLAGEGSRTARAMADRLVEMSHAVPNNVMVADGDEALVAELGTKAAGIRRGSDGVLAAANDFQENPDHFDRGRCERYESLVRAAGKDRGRMTVERMKSALFDARVWGLNIQATIFEPADMRMHLSINRNPASGGPYETFDVRELLGAAGRKAVGRSATARDID